MKTRVPTLLPKKGNDSCPRDPTRERVIGDLEISKRRGMIGALVIPKKD